MSEREACDTIYGPVQSRRHGASLGINLGSPSRKLCTWGCLYCQCGMGRVAVPGPGDGVPRASEVLERLALRLDVARSKGEKLDSVTFAGNSEPGAHPDFLAVVRGALELRRRAGDSWVLNCLSNGSELDRDDVAEACDLLDEAWIKLDCAIDALFDRLNRPLERVGSVERHLARIGRLRAPRIQTLLWQSPREPELATWRPDKLEALTRVFTRLRPVEIHLTTIQRLPAAQTLRPVAPAELHAFAARLAEAGHRVKVFP